MSIPSPKQPASSSARKPRKLNVWLIAAGGVMGCAAVALLIASARLVLGTPEPAATSAARQPAVERSEPSPKPVVAAVQKAPAARKPQDNQQPPRVVDDDGKSLWVSPTAGKPLDLSYLAPGAQLIISLRPAALLKHPEGEKALAAFGPIGQQAVDSLEHSTFMSLADIDRLVVGCEPASDGKWLLTLVVHVTHPISAQKLLAKLPTATEKDYSDKKYWLAGDRAYYLPAGADSKVLIIAPEEALHDVIDLAGQTPPLRRDIERLIAHTDSDRQITIILAPNSLFNEGQSLFRGEASRLRGPLFWFLGDELSGAALSMNWDENFFLEFIATPTLETSPEKAARIFADRVAQIPARLEQYLATVQPQPYAQSLVARFPEMLRKLAAYTRSGFERDHAVLRCYLPAIAGHNLFLAAELTLAESPTATTNSRDGRAASAALSLKTIKDRLAKVTSLKFVRDTLEAALDQLSQDIGAPIVIRGPDLQADGITKNQSFGIDVSNKPAEEILVEILRLANPDKTSPGPHDPRQKLVYIVEQKPDKTEQIVVTTRARAAERHDELPAAFRIKKP